MSKEEMRVNVMVIDTAEFERLTKRVERMEADANERAGVVYRLDDRIERMYVGYEALNRRIERLEASDEDLFRPYPEEDLFICPICDGVMKMKLTGGTTRAYHELYWYECAECNLRTGDRVGPKSATDDVRKLCGRVGSHESNKSI